MEDCNDAIKIRQELIRLNSRKASLHEESLELFNEARAALLRLVALHSQYELACKSSDPLVNNEYKQFIESMMGKYLLKKDNVS
ncbi:MAG: hypothetical protein RXO28_05240 [Thermocladium sp.]